MNTNLGRSLMLLLFSTALLTTATQVSKSWAASLAFTSAVNYPGFASPAWVLAGDFDGDGDKDLAVTNSADFRMSIMLNHGDGTFDITSVPTPSGACNGGQVSDLDGDGDMDLVMASGAYNNFIVLLNHGDGTFAEPVSYPAARPLDLCASDFDGDGDVDLAMGFSYSEMVQVMFNQGDGSFVVGGTYPTGALPNTIATSDFDGDGDNDIAVAEDGTERLRLLFNGGDGTFDTSTTYPILIYGHVRVGDLDSDGDVDIAVSHGTSPLVIVLLNHGDGTFASASYVAAGSGPIVVGDVDGDGDLDLPKSNIEAGSVGFLLNQGDGTFAASAVSYAVGVNPHYPCCTDLDGDGDNDLVVPNFGSNDVSVLFNISSVRVSAVHCPADFMVPGLSTIQSLSLVGFRITNAGPAPTAFSYFVSAQGPATLVDKGDPAALSGVTPVLDPGASYYPPEAGLIVPAIRNHVEERVTYHVADATNSSCTTVIVLEPPVPVFITAFDANVSDEGVRLTWDVYSDEETSGFKLYRGVEEGPIRDGIPSAGLIPPDARTYTDANVSGGRTYQYTLAVVLADGSEVRSPIVTVRTKPVVLALEQNIPNPFNPTTTIAFTLPARSRVTLSVFDVEGRLVRTLVDDSVGEGRHAYTWDGKNASGRSVSSGAYFYSLTADDRRITKKMVLLK